MAMDNSNARMESHMCFICPECGAEHDSQHKWRSHLNEEHEYLKKTCEDFDFKEIDERFHECKVCHKWVANAHNAIALLQYHRFLHLPFSRTYRCKHCTGAFTRKRALCEHLTRYHNRLITRLEKMQQSTNVIQEIKVKSPQMNPEFYLRFLCPQCGIQHDAFDQWLNHINTAHNVTSKDLRMHQIEGTQNHYCLQCRKLFYTNDKATLQRHRFSHLPYRSFFKCAYCSVKKNFKSEVLRHFILVHKREYASNRIYMRKPVEWGGNASDRLIKELSELLEKDQEKVVPANNNDQKCTASATNCKTSHQQSNSIDLIQTALMKSLIDLKAETEQTNEQVQSSRNPNEYALDQSINDLKGLNRDDCAETKSISLLRNSYINEVETDKSELEELCAIMFEEIEKEDQSSSKNFDHKTTLKETTDLNAEPYEEVISIEINALSEKDNDCERSPQPKRRKLQQSQVSLNTGEMSSNLQSQFNAHINYLCPECGSEFNEQKLWREHVFNAHDIVNAVQKHFKLLNNKCSYLCRDCKRIQYTDKHSELQRHLFLHMPYKEYLKCTICNATKSSKPKIQTHLKEMHADQLQNKITAHVNAREFECNDCGRKFFTRERWQTHRIECRQRMSGQKVALNIADSKKLLLHLRKAHLRIRKIAASCKISVK